MSETLQYSQSQSADTEIEIGTLVKYLLLDAIKAGASDIHIEPWESTRAVRVRLNGVLTELVHLPLEYMEKISGRFKVLANLVTYQTGLPQEGRAPADPELGGVEQRISIFPTTCSQPYEPEPALMRLVPLEDRETASFRRGAGCDQCVNTGFSGRTSVVELLTMDQAFRDAVMQKLPTKTLQQIAVTQGMQTMWQRGLRRVYKGETTMEEILRVISVDDL